MNKSISSLILKHKEGKFLPRSSDIKNFLDFYDQNKTIDRSRVSFKDVVILLSSMDEGDVEIISNSGGWSGPVSLGPLSDSIHEAALFIRNRNFSG